MGKIEDVEVRVAMAIAGGGVNLSVLVWEICRTEWQTPEERGAAQALVIRLERAMWAAGAPARTRRAQTAAVPPRPGRSDLARRG
jgi:hypothetical protein